MPYAYIIKFYPHFVIVCISWVGVLLTGESTSINTSVIAKNSNIKNVTRRFDGFILSFSNVERLRSLRKLAKLDDVSRRSLFHFQ